MNKNSFKNTTKLGDYVGTCDTCGQPFWASVGKVLDPYTGKGGAWVCPNCVDKVHYGFIPYVVEPEKPIPLARDANYKETTQPAVVIDFTKSPPTAG